MLRNVYLVMDKIKETNSTISVKAFLPSFSFSKIIHGNSLEDLVFRL